VNGQITFHPAPEREMLQAAEYYERESTSLADAFVAEVFSGLRLIEAHPEAARQPRASR